MKKISRLLGMLLLLLSYSPVTMAAPLLFAPQTLVKVGTPLPGPERVFTVKICDRAVF